MGIEKAGTTIGKEIIALARTSGRSLFTTKPVKVNVNESRLIPALQTDIVQFSTKAVKQEFSGNLHGIAPIKNREEYTQILEKLKQIYKRDCDYSGRLYDSRSGRDADSIIFEGQYACPSEFQGLIPYCGKNDISRDINVFLNNEKQGFCEIAKVGSYKYSKDFDKTQLMDIDSKMAKDYIKCLEYSLTELDKTYGKYEGLVYRGGLFNPKENQYYSTSYKYCRTQINCQRAQENQKFHIIKTTKGHKLYKFQEKYGSKHFAEQEMEILLPKDTCYLDITGSGKFDTEKREMAEAIYKDLNGEYPLNDILSKIKIWEEIS